MKWLCIFLPHKWLHIMDIGDKGLWQCMRCREISSGQTIESYKKALEEKK